MTAGTRPDLARGQLLTLAEASDEIGWNPAHRGLQKLARAGRLPAFILPGGRDWLIWRADWDSWRRDRNR